MRQICSDGAPLLQILPRGLGSGSILLYAWFAVKGANLLCPLAVLGAGLGAEGGHIELSVVAHLHRTLRQRLRLAV